MVKIRFPDFYCIGVQKAGTTWLHKHLYKNDDIWLMPNELKEIQYFNEIYVDGHLNWTQIHRVKGLNKLINKELSLGEQANYDAISKWADIGSGVRDDYWYGTFFSQANKKLCGDITPEYSMLPPEGVVHLKKLNEKAKVILILRHPVYRDFSHIKMILSNNFSDSLDGFDEKKIIQLMLEASDHIGVSERSHYELIVSNWKNFFSNDSLFIGFYEDIVDDPEKFMARIGKFLEVSVEQLDQTDLRRKVFEGKSLKFPDELKVKLFKRHADTICWVNNNYNRKWETS